MKVELDCHTHTVSSGHAYSTWQENAHVAASRGLKLIANTDHAPSMPGGAHEYYFQNLGSLPKVYEICRTHFFGSWIMWSPAFTRRVSRGKQSLTS